MSLWTEIYRRRAIQAAREAKAREAELAFLITGVTCAIILVVTLVATHI